MALDKDRMAQLGKGAGVTPWLVTKMGLVSFGDIRQGSPTRRLGGAWMSSPGE